MHARCVAVRTALTLHACSILLVKPGEGLLCSRGSIVQVPVQRHPRALEAPDNSPALCILATAAAGNSRLSALGNQLVARDTCLQHWQPWRETRLQQWRPWRDNGTGPGSLPGACTAREPSAPGLGHAGRLDLSGSVQGLWARVIDVWCGCAGSLTPWKDNCCNSSAANSCAPHQQLLCMHIMLGTV